MGVNGQMSKERNDARGEWVKRETGIKSMKKETGVKRQGNGYERETNGFKKGFKWA